MDEKNFKKKKAGSKLTVEGTGKNYDIRSAIYGLLDHEPFYGAMARFIVNVPNKNISTTLIKWNGKNSRYELHYNPDYMASLRSKCTIEQREIPVLLHDYLHLCFGHTDSRANKSGDKMYDEAMDLAVNSHIKSKLEFIKKHDTIPIPGEGKWANMPDSKSTEFYYEILKEGQEQKAQAKMKQAGRGMPGDMGSGGEDSEEQESSGMDEHDSGGRGDETGDNDLDGTDGDAEFERRKIMGQAIRTAQSSAMGWGTMSMDLQTQIIEMLRAKVDWTKVLRAAIHGMDKADKTSTYRKVNKRLPYIAPGKTHNKFPEIAVSIDQSGSVSDEFLGKFSSILNDLSKFVKFTIIPFDTNVDEEHIFVWKKDKKVPLRRTRSGGTDLSAPTAWVNKRKFELHLILTDMEAAEPIASRCRRIFVMPNGCRAAFATTERVIVMKD